MEGVSKMQCRAVHKMVERVLSNHILMGTISQEILTSPFHDTVLGINRQAWGAESDPYGQVDDDPYGAVEDVTDMIYYSILYHTIL